MEWTALLLNVKDTIGFVEASITLTGIKLLFYWVIYIII